jgi:lipopolysaccharide biosynthesis glycosyltransferase
MSAHIPVFLAADDNYAPFVATTIASICYNTKSFIDFYVLDGGITLLHKRQIYELKKNFPNFTAEFISCDVERIFSGFKINFVTSYATYAKILIPQLKPRLKKAIYSDVDIVALNDIASMYENCLSDYIIGAVYHAYFDKNKIFSHTISSRLNLHYSHRYFNAGSLLINCNKWRKLKVTENLFTIANIYNQQILNEDQDILNKYFDNNSYAQLDYKFNLTTRNLDFFYNTDMELYKFLAKNVVLRHFENKAKPWLTDVFYEGKPLMNFEDFWFFAEMTLFYPGLQQRFIASRARNEIFLCETINNIVKPDKKMLNSLRARILSQNR